MFTINIHSDCRIEEYDYDTIISKVKNEFNARNINALLSRYGNNIVGCFQNVDKTAAVSNAEGNVSDNNISDSSISEINPVNLSVKNIHNTDIGIEDELDEKKCWTRFIIVYQST